MPSPPSSARSRFAGGDQAYLRDEQYRDPSRLSRRATLHARYGTATTPWFDWVTARLQLQPDQHVLEAGCGPGWLWIEAAERLPPGVQLTLTDLSEGMVAAAVGAVRATGRPARVDGRAADLQELPFDDAVFDRVVANHMLYHLPDPARGVAELARVVRDDGLVMAATNGRGHLRQLWSICGRVFAVAEVDPTVEVFGVDAGFPVLREHFADVRWHRFADELRCTDPDDVLAYVCSAPPGEDASAEQLDELRAAIAAAFAAGDGVMRITKDVGCFVCRAPLR
jgi:SAM-dependent methyltransferase